MDIETLVREAAELSRDDQLELIARLQDRLFADPESGVDDDLRTELERRFADDEWNPDGGSARGKVEERF